MKKINFSDIKEIFKKNSLEFFSDISNDETFLSIKTISSSLSTDLSFFSNIKYLNYLKSTNAKACLIEEKYAGFLPKKCKPIIVKDPYLALALLTKFFSNETIKSNGNISKNAFIDSDCKLHNNVQIEPFCTIKQNTEIYENVYVGPNSYIGPNVILHQNVIIHNNVSISNSIIMENCTIKSGAIIGGSGFGFDTKTKNRIHHNGNVLIGKNTSIGSNTTIDRAVFETTSIGNYSNIDNLVQIAHNVSIGDYAIVAAQVGIAGSTQIGKNIKIGGQAGIAGHLVIGDNVTIAAKSGVTKNIPDNNVVAGFPAKDINLWKKEVIRNSLKK